MKDFFKDDRGNMSSLRLNLFLTLLLSIYVTVYQVHLNTVDLGLIAMLFGIVFGAKNVDTHLKTKRDELHTTDRQNDDSGSN